MHVRSTMLVIFLSLEVAPWESQTGTSLYFGAVGWEILLPLLVGSVSPVLAWYFLKQDMPRTTLCRLQGQISAAQYQIVLC